MIKGMDTPDQTSLVPPVQGVADLTPIERQARTIATIGDASDFIDAWLANRWQLSDRTREAYRSDVREYLQWCLAVNLHPTQARFVHINEFGRWLAETPAAWTGRPRAKSSIARKLSAVSSWYNYLVALGAVATNPAMHAERPRLDPQKSDTVAFTAAEAQRLLDATRTDPWLPSGGSYAVTLFLIEIGARVSEVCTVTLGDLGWDSGHRTVLLRMKGGKTRTRAIPPSLVAALDTYLTSRGVLVDPNTLLFVHPDGRPITRQQVFRFMRHAARAAGLAAADRITPHSFRHTWATIARERGASLEERQHALGHADPRTTQRYDHARASLDRDPSYLVAAAIAQ